MAEISPYEKKVLAAFKKVAARTGEGASATEVCEQMAKDKTLSALDTVIDIADVMQKLADFGHIGQRSGRE